MGQGRRVKPLFSREFLQVPKYGRWLFEPQRPHERSRGCPLSKQPASLRHMQHFDQSRGLHRYAHQACKCQFPQPVLQKRRTCDLRSGLDDRDVSQHLSNVSYADIGIMPIMPMFGLCRVFAGDCFFRWVPRVFRLHKTAAEIVRLSTRERSVWKTAMCTFRQRQSHPPSAISATFNQ